MAIKEAPITYRAYYKKLMEDYTQLKKDAKPENTPVIQATLLKIKLQQQARNRR